MKILVTGATGNVGIEVIKALTSFTHQHEIHAAVRDLQKNEVLMESFANVRRRKFDFDKTENYPEYLQGIDVLFLMRPPHISNVKKHYQPLLEAAITSKIAHIVFLSVQGVETSTMIPHYKIEKLIRQSGLAYTFLRPAYFMQNFSTTLRKEIVDRKRIYLSAGKALFNLIDVKDVGEVAARIILHPSEHKNKSYDLTNGEQFNFETMCDILSEVIGHKLDFVSANLISFFIQKKNEGLATNFILVMIMLHYLPRFQKPHPISDWVEKLLGKPPTTFYEFAEREKYLLI
jgi:uncharacterized protein YbjT (DUF2867 family)